MLTDAGGAEMEHAGDVVAITVTGSLFQIDVSENVSGKFGRCRLTPPTRGWFGERAGAGGSGRERAGFLIGNPAPLRDSLEMEIEGFLRSVSKLLHAPVQ